MRGLHLLLVVRDECRPYGVLVFFFGEVFFHASATSCPLKTRDGCPAYPRNILPLFGYVLARVLSAMVVFDLGRGTIPMLATVTTHSIRPVSVRVCMAIHTVIYLMSSSLPNSVIRPWYRLHCIYLIQILPVDTSCIC